MTVLTIDIGSTSLRTNLFDQSASRQADFEAQVLYEMRSVDGGGVEIDPDELANCLFSGIDQTLAKAGAGVTSIDGVGFCSLVSNVLGVDKSGRPTTPIYTWADTRCAPQAEALRSKLDEAEVHDRTGCRIHTSYLPARLLWLREEMTEVYKRTACWISFGEYAQLLLLGRYSQSLSVASWSGLLNSQTLDWDDWLLAKIGLHRENLPQLVDAYDGARGLKPEFATRWPALAGALWFPCIGDGVTGNLGSGCYSPDQWAVQIGTSGAMRTLVPDNAESETNDSAQKPNRNPQSPLATPQLAGPQSAIRNPQSAIRIPMGLWSYRLDRRLALIGGALSEGGNVIAWLRDNLRIDDFSAAEKEAASLPPDSHGLTMLPFIAGERSPDWNPSARMLISGISLSTRPPDLLRAAQEAIVYRFAAVFDLLSSVLPVPNMIAASGGALLNTPGWMQMLADALGHAVTASNEEEASSKGAAMIALRALGQLHDYSQVPASFGAVFQPDMSRHEIYRKAIARQHALYEEARGGDEGLGARGSGARGQGLVT
jgi:gluconokinase